MAKLAAGTLRRLRNRYRLVVINDDTYEEMATFRLTRTSVYVLLSTLFVVMVGVTAAFIVFTPLKYYIPGYGSAKVSREYRQLKFITDSLERQVSFQTRYIEDIRKVLSGNVPIKLDTTQYPIPKDEFAED